jgi:hypothetical protein
VAVLANGAADKPPDAPVGRRGRLYSRVIRTLRFAGVRTTVGASAARGACRLEARVGPHLEIGAYWLLAVPRVKLRPQAGCRLCAVLNRADALRSALHNLIENHLS